MPETPGKSPFYALGLRFSCIRCSACCRYESGFVFLSGKDAIRLAAALNMEYRAFTETFCRWVFSENGQEQLALKEKTNFDCIFWTSEQGKADFGHEGGCSVYEARPLQCRAFPFWPSIVSSGHSWKMTASECPGMDKGELHSPNSVDKWLAERQKEPIIFRDIKNKGES